MPIRSGLFGIGLLIGALSGAPGTGAEELTDRMVEDLELEAVHNLDRVTELWEEERFDDLYDWGTEQFRALMTREQFTGLMQNGTRGPQCCWMRFQNAKGLLEGPDRVEVTVTIGYRYSSNAVHPGPNAPMLSEFVEESFILVREADRWRLDLGQVLDRAWIPGRRLN